jgi:hypothetical protein
MKRRSSLPWSTVPELNSGEGADPSGWGAALGSVEALGPTHGERGGVRWLGTDCVAGTEADKRPRARTRNGVASSYRCTHGLRGIGWLRRSVQRMVMLR